MDTRIRTIEISFPCKVNLPPGFERALDGLINMICDQYELEHPDRTMWPAGSGGKPLGNLFVSDNIDFDMAYLCIDVAEREAYDNEISRRLHVSNKIVEMRAEILRMAEDLKQGHTNTNGEWPSDDPGALEEYQRLTALAES